MIFIEMLLFFLFLWRVLHIRRLFLPVRGGQFLENETYLRIPKVCANIVTLLTELQGDNFVHGEYMVFMYLVFTS